jgi:hypothetical protein
MNKRFNSWEDLLAAKTEQRGDCIIWQAGTHSQGYPMVKWDSRMVQVVRQQIETKTGQKLDGRRQRVKNTVCGDVLCVNPDHYMVADQGTEEWKCINFVYDLAAQKRVREIYDDYTHPRTGTKYGAYFEVIKEYPRMTRTTMISILKKTK